RAQSYLGVMYAAGQGVPQDHAEAVKWFRKAADQGDLAGQAGLGLAYANGEGVPQDHILAYMWLNLAATRASGALERDFVVKNRDRIAQTMTPAQLAEAQRLAREWKPK